MSRNRSFIHRPGEVPTPMRLWADLLATLLMQEPDSETLAYLGSLLKS